MGTKDTESSRTPRIYQVGLAMGMERVDVENPKEMLGGNSECSENSSSM